MSTTVAFIGTGPEPDNPVWGESAAMAYRHAAGYERLDGVSLVACADIVEENAQAFAAEFGIGDDRAYTEYAEMLADVEPDVVSVCTPVRTHADIVIDCAASGNVDAIHCEKPMAHTWGASRLMVQECERRDVALTFNHQRRTSEPTRRIGELLDDGAIGDLQRVEVATKNVYDAGTHFIDLCGYFNDDRPAEWVIGQIDYREENVRYGVHNENQALVQWRYDNGVHGIAATGVEGFMDCDVRLVGANGEIELNPPGDAQFRVRRGSNGWEERTTGGGMADLPAAVESVVRAVEGGEESELCARNALNTTEIIFGAYESARRRGRVDLPLEINDNPLIAMVKSGDLQPATPEDGN